MLLITSMVPVARTVADLYRRPAVFGIWSIEVLELEVAQIYQRTRHCLELEKFRLLAT